MDDPVGYLHRTAINIFRDRSRRLLAAMKRAVRSTPRPDEYEALEARSVAASLLGRLPPRQRAAIVLTEVLGYSAEEAGELLGIKGSTVRALHFQARSALMGFEETIDG
jgi:RNA polymerase sigma-70 factor, ECF subfamily